MGGFGLKSGLSPSADDVRLCERVQRIVAADVLGPNRLPQLLRIGDVRDLGRFGGRLGDVAGRRCVSWLGVGLGEFQIGGKANRAAWSCGGLIARRGLLVHRSGWCQVGGRGWRQFGGRGWRQVGGRGWRQVGGRGCQIGGWRQFGGSCREGFTQRCGQVVYGKFHGWRDVGGRGWRQGRRARVVPGRRELPGGVHPAVRAGR